jgi:hypothetical protein
MPQRWAGTIVRSRRSAVARWRAGTNRSTCRKNSVWSAASIRDRPHTAAGLNARMPTRRASRTSASLPTMSRTRVAATLSDQRTIGSSRSRSASRSDRSRTAGSRRYATSSIAFSTLADGTVRRTPTP